MWKAVSQEDKIEQARNDCILNVAAYVKANPRARPMEIQKKVQDEIEIFKEDKPEVYKALRYILTSDTKVMKN